MERSAVSRAAVVLCGFVVAWQTMMGSVAPAAATSAAPPPPISPPTTAPGMIQQPTEAHPLDHGSRTELLDWRTEDSRTFRNADGTFTTDYFSAPVFYRDAGGSFVPIEAVPVPSASDGIAYQTKAGPVIVRFGDTSTAPNAVSVTRPEDTISFSPKLPATLSAVPTPMAVAPTSDGQHVTYPGVYPGIDLRYTLLPTGVKEDIVLTKPGGPTIFAFALDLGGLKPTLEADGSISLGDADGVAYRLPRPFMVDSAPERDGDGARSYGVSYELTQVEGTTVLVVDADAKWLDAEERVYPVYIDPTFNASLDTFISSGYPSYNLNAQWNPGEGGYYELWNGRYDAVSGTNYAFVKTGIPSGVSVYSATFKVYVQHSYMGATATGIQLGRLTSAFSESQTWNMTHPSYVALTSTTVADNQWASFNVLSTVQSWVEGTATNHGFRIYQASTSQTLWKRLRARENATNIPYLTVTYAVPSASVVSPTGGAWTNSSLLDWTYADGGSGYGQTKYQAQVSTSSSTWSGGSLKADSGVVTSSATSWTAPTGNLVNGTTYYWRVKVFDGHTWSAWSSVASFKRDTVTPTYTSTTVAGAITAAAPDYYDLGNGSFTIAIRGSDANAGIKLTYLRLYNATDELRVRHDWSVGGTHCNEFDTSTLADVTACAETYNSGGTREVTFTVVGLNQNASLDIQYAITDGAGNGTGYVDSGKNLIFDATPPTGAITAPAAGSTVSGAVPIVGTASDANFKEYQLHFGVGASPLSWTAIGTNPYTSAVTNGSLGTWNAGALANSIYTLRLRVYDKARVSSGFTEVLRTVTLDNTLPVATITAPLTATHVRGTISITGTASAPVGFTDYTLHYGSGCSPSSWTDIGTNPRTSQVTNGTLGTWDTTGVADGSYTIRLIATKSGPVSQTATACVTVDNTPPTGSLTAPTANSPLSGLVTLSGSATDTLGFADYLLEIGAGSSPSSWTTIGTYTTPVSGGTLASWDSTALTGVHTLRLTVHDQAGNAPAVVTRLVYLDNSRRGQESYYTPVPFDLGGGWQLGVGMANGELRLDRALFSIPSYGPPQALELSYSSLETSADGRYGVGWSSNLTQYLTFESGFVVWHRADGGRVPFGNVAGSWTPLAGHFETLTGTAGSYTITLKDQTQLVFADTAPGRLQRIENRFGTALTLTWNASSATATDASGRSTTLTIDAANNRITAAADSAGRAWGFGYTGTDLTTVTDPRGAVTTLAYDASHRLTTISRLRTPASGPDETITWSVGYASGKVSSLTDPVNTPAAHTFGYAPGTATASLLRDTLPDPDLLNVTSYSLDAWGRVTAWTDPAGWTTSQTFDPHGNLLSITRPIDAATSATTSYTYDARGNTLTETVPLDATTSVTTTMTYNASNDQLTRDEADGSAIELRTAYTYTDGHLTQVEVNPQLPDGPDGRVVTSYTYAASHQLETETDPLGRVTKYTYDAHGNRTGEIRNFVAGQSATAERNVMTGYAYDLGTAAGRAGLATSQTDPVGVTVTYTYDALGRQLTEALPGDASIPALTRTTSYDQLGNLLTSVESWTGSTRTSTNVYDRLNRLTSQTDAAGAVTSTAYDAAGNPIRTTTADGTSSRTHDGLGQVVEEATPDGTVTTHTYDAQGRETSTTVTTGTPTSTSRTFDLAGRLLDETIDDGALALTTSYQYDALGRTLLTTDPDGLVTTQTYDRVGRVIQSVADVSVTDYTFDKVSNQLTVDGPHAAGANGPVTKSTYDALNRQVEQIANFVAGSGDPAANLTNTTYYDAAGHVLASRDPKGTVSRSIVNARGLTSRGIENCTDAGTTPSPDPASCVGAGTHNGATNLVIDTAFDGSGATLTTSRQAVAGNVLTESTYDAGGRLVKVVQDKGSGTLNLTTEYAYDALGRQTAVRDPRGTVSRSLYDAEGRLVQTIQNCTNTGQTVPTSGWASCAGTGDHDATWNVTTSYAYDARGNQVSELAANGRETRSGYDGADRLIWRTENYVAEPPSPAPADVNLTTYFYYDPAGRQVAVKAPTADRDTVAVTRLFYDDLGRLTTEVRNCTSSGTQVPADPATCTGLGTANASTNVTTSYAYDATGQRVAVIAPDPTLTGSGTATVTTRYAYDGAGRLCRVLENASVDLQGLADPCSTAVSGSETADVSTRYAYDAAGNLISMLDGEGQTTTYGYDRAGRMTARTDPNGQILSWSYDERGNRTGQVNRSDTTPSSPTVTWTYDGGDRMISRSADGATVSYAYDANGNRTSADGPQGEITATYDRLNRPLTVTAEDGSATSFTYDFAAPSRSDPSGSYVINLDAFGREISLTDPLHPGSPFSTAYRADGQPATQTAPNANQTSWSYDAVGNLTALASTAAGGSPSRAAYTYTYNQAGLRVAETSTLSGDPTNGGVTYTYDSLARLTGYARAGAATQSYAWGAVPNRERVQVGTDPAVTTSFDAANRPTADSAGGSYSHDLDGQLTARPGQLLEWDSLGRLTTVRPSGGGSPIATYTYDALDRLRVVDYGGSNRIRFRYVGLTTAVAQVVDDQSGSAQLNVGTSWSGERLLDWTAGGASQRFYGTNAHHDVTWTAGPTGSVTATLRYDPWGNLAASTGASLPDWRFQGSWFDTTTDLSWVVTRWYAPALGTFVSEDDLLGDPHNPGSRQLYAYGAGDPVSKWDPEGRFWYRIRSGDTLGALALRWWWTAYKWPTIWNANRNRVANPNLVLVGQCIFIPKALSWDPSNCSGSGVTGYWGLNRQYQRWVDLAEARLGVDFENLTAASLRSLTYARIGRSSMPSTQTLGRYLINAGSASLWAENAYGRSGTYSPDRRGFILVRNHRRLPRALNPSTTGAITFGYTIYLGSGITTPSLDLLAHEYIHTMQYEIRGTAFIPSYLWNWVWTGSDANNPLEAPGYLWEGWTKAFSRWEKEPWEIWKRPGF